MFYQGPECQAPELGGIVGSLLATFAGKALGMYSPGEPAGFVGSLVGAIFVLVLYQMVRRNSPA